MQASASPTTMPFGISSASGEALSSLPATCLLLCKQLVQVFLKDTLAHIA